MSFPPPSELQSIWRGNHADALDCTYPVIAFYGHKNGPYRSFSNFYQHEPFVFVVPEACNMDKLTQMGCDVTVPCTFSEKAIMLCKAAIMEDYETYRKIHQAPTPQEVKQLGRMVYPWDQKRWNKLICHVALQVVLQKFAGVPGLKEILLSTKKQILAEMTNNDKIWGTGINTTHKNAQRPALWPGTNILGWALMQARSEFAKEDAMQK